MFKVLLNLNWILLGMLFDVAYLNDNPCTDSIYMKIPYTSKLIDSFISVNYPVSSAYECLELCRNRATCKSVGIETSSMTCYLYAGRIFAGQGGAVKSNLIYYWLLEPECPVDLGYSEDPTSKICTKYVSKKVTWFQALDQCELEGAMLFMADNDNSKRVITDYGESGVLGKLTFMGASDINEEGLWEWFNGVPVNISWFITGNTNKSLNNEDCMVYSKYSTEELVGLDDYACLETEGFICQVPTKQTYLP